MRRGILKSLVVNDLKRNKAINMTLFLFLFISALLMATGALVIERLSGSLDQIFEIAQPPHFMQMHVGPIDRDGIERFAAGTGMVKAVEIQDMVNVEGLNIVFERKDLSVVSLSDSMMDNYFITQNKTFDYLLDLENRIVELHAGEIGVPVSYAKQKQVEVGDTAHITVEGRVLDLKVAYIIRDAQMGSSLASSIRFLVNAEDFKVIKENTLRHESIIGFRLKNEGDINAFSDLYQQEASGMPKNGVAITLPLIALMNGIGDGLMSGVIMLVSLVLVIIAILNMRFTVLSALEDEVKEIGTLKAIGLRNRDINGVYKVKYRFLTLLACLMAAFASFLVANVFLDNISLNFGVSETSIITYMVPFLAVLLMYMIVMLSLHRVLRIVAQMTILDALKEGRIVSAKGKHKARFVAKLRRGFSNLDFKLALHQYRQNLKPWLLFIVVFLLSTFTILLPLNMYMTMSSPEFTNYVGAAKSDMRITVEYHSKLDGVIMDMEKQLASDPQVLKWNRFKSIKGKVAMRGDSEGEMTSFLVESGNYDMFPVKMDMGRLPDKAGEIALSSLNQNKLGLAIGDSLTVMLADAPEIFEVVGVYQDITNGGLTAKIFSGYDGDIAQVAFFADLSETADVRTDGIAEAWGKKFPSAKVIPVEKLIEQTLGSLTASLRIAVVAVFILAIAIMGLISVLFITLRMHKNDAEDGVLLAIGFNARSIRWMYCIQSLISMVIGIALGAAGSLFLGESLMRLMLSMMQFGLTQMTFLIQPLTFIVIGCIIPLIVGMAMTWQVTGRISKKQVTKLGCE
jgi:putative ABC transport system permease protein